MIGNLSGESSNHWKNWSVNFQSLDKPLHAEPGRPLDSARGRPLSSLLALLIIPLFVGLLIAPFVYNPLRFHSRHTKSFEFLEPLKFEKVAGRCVKIVAIILLVPLVRRSGLGPQIKRALTPDPVNRRDLALACVVGCGSMAAFYAVGWVIGAYAPEEYLTVGRSLTKPVSFVIGAIFIGIFEETFFRGFVFGTLRTRTRFWPAAMVASLFFALIHFVTPEFPGRIRGAWWDQGLKLLPYIFAGFNWAKDWPFFCTLFIMGLTLCVIYERRGHLAWCIGLHGGWVLAMQLGNYFLGRNREYLEWWFSRSDYISKGPIAIPLIFVFFLWTLTLPPKKAS